MSFPNFLGIGAQRCGTTWLDAMLRGHPQVYLPTRRKEIHYFDQYYDRGPAWYEKFFQAEDIGTSRKAIGEITPRYLFSPEAASRIARDFPYMRLIALLRNPVDRVYSQFGLESAKGRVTREDFRSFLDRTPEAFARGLYHDQLQRYFEQFPRQQILVLVFEEVMAAREAALGTIFSFLGLDEKCGRLESIASRVGESRLPRFSRGRALASRLGGVLRDFDLDWMINAAKTAGADRIFGDLGRMPALANEDRDGLELKYEADILKLEELLGRKLSLWRRRMRTA